MGNECAGDGHCQARGVGLPVCAVPCTVGAGAVAGNTATYAGNTQGCNADYTCIWDGQSDAPNGGCFPGAFNPTTVNNIGAACESDSECYSPFGNGVCDADFGCIVLDCGVPGMPDDVCGPAADCFVLQNQPLCIRTCSAASDCAPSIPCVDADNDPLTAGGVCAPLCQSDTECRAGQTCDTTTGYCV
ncbi:MAG: hypothetical protein R3A47_07295 [Polyangiales bacterium]